MSQFESQKVHKFYKDFHSSFSTTRYIIWPYVRTFLSTTHNPSHLILDSGCGNGRCILYNNIIGMDFSYNLLQHAKQSRVKKSLNERMRCKNVYNPCITNTTSDHYNITPPLDILRGDCLSVPFKDCTYNTILSIAVLHHISTEERRNILLKEIYRILIKGGLCLIAVWNIKYKNNNRFIDIPYNDLPIQTSGDVYAKWSNQTIRYCHLFSRDEICKMCVSVGFTIEEVIEEYETLYVKISK